VFSAVSKTDQTLDNACPQAAKRLGTKDALVDIASMVCPDKAVCH
jgi:hypothetical protein